MDLKPRIAWVQGLFLTPQHLQQQDLLHDGALRSVWGLVHPFGWGVVRLVLGPLGAPPLTLDIREVEAIMANGTFVRGGTPADSRPGAMIPGANAVIHPAALPQPAGAAMVCLVLARALPDAAPVASETEATTGLSRSRYVGVITPTPNLLDHEATTPHDLGTIPFLLRIEILPVGSDTDRAVETLARTHEVLPLAKLVARNDRWELADDYAPPALHVRLQRQVFEKLEDLHAELTKFCTDFARRREGRALSSSVGAAQDLTLFLVLGCLNRITVALQQVIEDHQCHPLAAYGALRMAVADLAAFSSDTSHLGEAPSTDRRERRDPLPRYYHQNAWPGFDQAIHRIKHLVLEIGLGPVTSVELDFMPPDAWGASLEAEFFDGRAPKFFLIVESNLPPERVQDGLKDRKIGARKERDDLIIRNLLGLRLTYLRYPPEQLPQRSNRFIYYEIDQEDSYWIGIKKLKNISVYCPELTKFDVKFRLVKIVSD